MRVIGGNLRGRILLGPRGRDTRPITDRVKENLFNIVRDWVPDAVVADCFCGTGSLGIEALSRGAAHASFADVDGSAIGLLRENLDALRLAERGRILRHDVARKGLPPCPPAGPYSLVFFDPPYRLSETDPDRLWFKLCESADPAATDDVLMVWRHDARLTLTLPEPLADRWEVPDVRRYGSQTLTFIRRRRIAPAEPTEP